MKLDSDQRARLQEILAPLLRALPCAVCHDGSWAISDGIFQFEDGAHINRMRQQMPLVVVVCQRCGHTHLFSAIAIGFLDRATGKPIAPGPVLRIVEDGVIRAATHPRLED